MKKKFSCFVLITITILFSTNIFAKDYKCIIGECKEDISLAKSLPGEIFIGQFQNSQPNGLGVLLYTNGSRFVGEFKNGKPNGLGYLIFPLDYNKKDE